MSILEVAVVDTLVYSLQCNAEGYVCIVRQQTIPTFIPDYCTVYCMSKSVINLQRTAPFIDSLVG